ncbi:hypothetical protein [Listeria ilorinensis]|uniref:hypothetical protein n=1 Tax=Listeria ilorinensis TaxID=2867439 RepID=UPI001EF52EE1|nr:hypothetical protein [Listeria ilorinensis]
MQVLLTGSHQLTAFDQAEIQVYLKKYAPQNQIHLLAYKSVENPVLTFFLENEALAPRLFLYTLAKVEVMSEPFKTCFAYLTALGATHQVFGTYKTMLERSVYEHFYEQLIAKMDLVTCFYNGDKTTDLIAVDLAKKAGVQSIIVDLPKTKKHLIHRNELDKFKLIN